MLRPLAIALGLTTALVAPGMASAQHYHTRVRLRGLDRDLMVVVHEPGQSDSLSFDGNLYDHVYPDSSGGLTADRQIPGGSPTQIETISILTDTVILGAFKASPYWSAMSMAFVNANEVRCSPRSEAVLMITEARTPRRIVGNCFGFSQEGQ